MRSRLFPLQLLKGTVIKKKGDICIFYRIAVLHFELKFECTAPRKLRYSQICRIRDELLKDIVKSKIASLNNSSRSLVNFLL